MRWRRPVLRLALLAVLPCCVLPLLVAAKVPQKFDHRSHAVAGKDQTVRDFDGDGFAEVSLNGELSHSHYFNPKNSSDNGRIVEYKWTEDRLGTVIGREMKIKHQFPVGKTVVTLKVKDNTNDTATDTVEITVEPSGSQGAYFYYYDMKGEVPTVDVLNRLDDKPYTEGFRPNFGTVVQKINFVKPWEWPQLPKGIEKGPFGIQIKSDFLALRDGNYTFYLACSSGHTSLHVAGEKVLTESNTGPDHKVLRTKPVTLSKGKHHIQVRFFTENPMDPVVILGVKQNGPIAIVPPELLSFHAHRVVPTIHEATPLTSTLGGGGVMRINGAGFYGDVSVKIGSLDGLDVQVKHSNRITLKIPSSKVAQDVLLTVVTKQGASNVVPFSYTKAAPMPIKFKKDVIKYENGTTFPSSQFTSIALGPDLRYYFGSLDSHVHVVTIRHDSMTAIEHCKSVGTGMGRSITGIAFDPADTVVRAYISTNVFYWRNYYSVPDNKGWHNGKIQALIKGKGKNGACLIHEKDVVTGLPVSNHDHGVNTLVFDNDGNLYMQIGGSTNAGVSTPDDLVGGVKESVLSSATVVAHLREPGFNGTVVYDQYDDPGSAKKITPDKHVEAFAFGFRNSFGSVFHSSGNIFATDNGPNKGYGEASTSCNTTGPDPWHPDSLVLVQKGSYFGYPNRARGLQGDERQCKYYGADEPERNGFTPGLATFDASTNGVLEYTANCFEGQMKGDLLISKYAVQGSGKLFRAQLDATMKALKGPIEDFSDYSGLSISMNPYGVIVMPRVQQSNVAILVPDEEKASGLKPILTAVSPSRGPAKGANIVFISGRRLGTDPTILFGGKPCKFLRGASDESWVLCTPPSGKGSVQVKLKTPGGEYASRSPDYHYMSY